MSFVVDAFALLPAVAALIVVVAALRDRHDADDLDQIRSLHLELP